MRKMPAATMADFEEAARVYFSRLTVEMDRPRGYSSDPERFDHEVAYSLHLNDERNIELREQLKRNEFDGIVRSYAVKMAEILGLDFDQLTDGQKTQLSRLAIRTEVAESELFRHQITDPLAPFTPSDKLFSEAPTPHSALKVERPSERPISRSLKSVAEEYVGRKRAKQITENQIAELERGLGWLSKAHPK